ncbi:50S ribosomal protein L9 [Pacificimonas flava]|uniref:Large ribosomal subunit protein bL9 n=2 Tax=Pacificimonas TaxID=1960290 RepID=A0A219B9F6_9SPHN|nr:MULTISPECIES: 50S ribosomal protein L9 [Pacificimonas]MBZ6379874.1 50S ribosomal protein L9 [Pacificimonas aurantium]OWV34794.1 50S ribosomal protein L9 [Pacificimonas flava]
MDIILLERVEKLGSIGDVVSVKPGFARNFLLPQGKALRANEQNKAKFEAERERIEQENAAKRTDAEKDAETLAGTQVVLIRQSSDSGQLYGSVNSRDIAAALSEKSGLKIDKTQVTLEAPIKTLGVHSLVVALHPEVQVEVEANVARSEDEAELQAQGISVLGGNDDDEALTESERLAKEALERAERQAAAEASGIPLDENGEPVEGIDAEAAGDAEAGDADSGEAAEGEAEASEEEESNAEKAS